MADPKKLREDAQSEIDHRIQEQTRQREAVQERKKRRFEALYIAWLPKFLEWKERKDEEKDDKQAKTPKFGSSTESDSEASEGYEYEVEEVDTSDLDSDAAEDKQRMDSYHDEKARRRFQYELANPKIFSRTMSEGEPVAVKTDSEAGDADEDEEEEWFDEDQEGPGEEEEGSDDEEEEASDEEKDESDDSDSE
ncbi:prothymosin alpha-like [Papaver somniferum]|uniref:prothymosin alpha-like n=1 Tax=Papaver somniferum TaxID=3469 RepID=UPI000E701470|nr:prothymosin alpha-like [Papaver somniferum]